MQIWPRQLSCYVSSVTNSLRAVAYCGDCLRHTMVSLATPSSRTYWPGGVHRGRNLRDNSLGVELIASPPPDTHHHIFTKCSHKHCLPDTVDRNLSRITWTLLQIWLWYETLRVQKSESFAPYVVPLIWLVPLVFLYGSLFSAQNSSIHHIAWFSFLVV